MSLEVVSPFTGFRGLRLQSMGGNMSSKRDHPPRDSGTMSPDNMRGTCLLRRDFPRDSESKRLHKVYREKIDSMETMSRTLPIVYDYIERNVKRAGYCILHCFTLYRLETTFDVNSFK